MSFWTDPTDISVSTNRMPMCIARRFGVATRELTIIQASERRQITAKRIECGPVPPALGRARFDHCKLVTP